MDLNQLRERGAFVSQSPVEHEVSWTHDQDGQAITDTFTVHVVKHSAGTVERLRMKAQAEKDLLWGPLLISETIRLGDDGSERLTYQDAQALDTSLARVLMDAINTVNGTGAAAKN